MATKKTAGPSKALSGTRATLGPWIAVAFLVVVIDQVTKLAAENLFDLGDSRPVTSFFNLVLAYNKGAAFSFLATESGWQRYFFTAVGIGAVAFIIHLLRKHPNQRMFCWSLALIMGGAVGNVIDRVLYGHVIDFLDFHHPAVGHFPAFNIADTAITIGAFLFILDELRRVNKA